jgi:SH3-like domain-containing protein
LKTGLLLLLLGLGFTLGRQLAQAQPERLAPDSLPAIRFVSVPFQTPRAGGGHSIHHLGEPRIPPAEQEKPANSSPALLPLALVTAEKVNIRQGPSLSALKIGSTLKHERAEVLEQRPPWIRLHFPDRKLVGWVHQTYLRIFSEDAALDL